MAEKSIIEWTRSTFNPWIGCTKVSSGCDECYAAVSTPARAMKIEWGAGKPRHRTSPSTWAQVRRWNAKAAATGEFRPVFTASLADVFDNEVPDEWRADFSDGHETHRQCAAHAAARLGRCRLSECLAANHRSQSGRGGSRHSKIAACSGGHTRTVDGALARAG